MDRLDEVLQILGIVSDVYESSNESDISGIAFEQNVMGTVNITVTGANLTAGELELKISGGVIDFSIIEDGVYIGQMYLSLRFHLITYRTQNPQCL